MKPSSISFWWFNESEEAPRVETLRQGTTLHKIIMQFEGWNLKRMEEINWWIWLEKFQQIFKVNKKGSQETKLLASLLVSYALISLFQDISRMNMFTRFTLLQLHPVRQPMANLGSGKLQM